MDKSSLLAKTEKGRLALSARSAELGPKLRSMLILVDGKRNVAELDRLGAGLGGGLGLLEQLLAGGWVADPAGAPSVAARPTGDTQPDTLPDALPAVAPARPAPVALPLPEAQRQVVRFLNDQLGPMGELTALRVEGCKTAADLQAVLPRVRDALRNYKNSATVQRFDTELVPLLPRG